MAWKIEIDKKALKEIAALDKPIQKRITTFLKDKLAKTENPCAIGEALQGGLKNFWKYRVGNYRIICSIEDKKYFASIIGEKFIRKTFSLSARFS